MTQLGNEGRPRAQARSVSTDGLPDRTPHPCFDRWFGCVDPCSFLRVRSMNTPVEDLRARVDVVACLERAKERIRAKGWVRARVPNLNPRADDRAPKGYTLVEALVPPEGADDAAGQLSAWHARFVLVKVTGAIDLVGWSAHPYLTKRDVLSALDKAIRLSRGTPVHRGGWSISTAPIRAPRSLAARTLSQPTPNGRSRP